MPKQAKIVIVAITGSYSFPDFLSVCQFGSYLRAFSPGRLSFGVPFKLSVLSSFALLTEPGVAPSKLMEPRVAPSNLFGGVVSGKIYVFVNLSVSFVLQRSIALTICIAARPAHLNKAADF